MYGISRYKEKLALAVKSIVDNLLLLSDNFNKSYFVCVDNVNALENVKTEEWFATKVNVNDGIWIGEDIGSQIILNINNLDSNDRNIQFEDMSFVITDGNYKVIKHIVMGDANEK